LFKIIRRHIQVIGVLKTRRYCQCVVIESEKQRGRAIGNGIRCGEARSEDDGAGAIGRDWDDMRLWRDGADVITRATPELNTVNGDTRAFTPGVVGGLVGINRPAD
jgi:hypothetical protein